MALPSASAVAVALLTFADQALPATVAVVVPTTLLDASRMLTVTTWPSSTPPVVPLTAKPEAASDAFSLLSPAIGVAMAMIGGVSSTVSVRVAWAAALPAESDPSTFTV